MSAYPDNSASLIAALPMVKAMARRYRGTRLEYEDAVGAGNLALVKAARSFDPTRGTPFVSYASSRVRGAMLDALRYTRGTRARPDQETPIDPDEMAERFSVESPACDAIDVHRAIAKLIPADRHVVMLVIAGHSGREIADMFGVSESRVAQRMIRVRGHLAGAVAA